MLIQLSGIFLLSGNSLLSEWTDEIHEVALEIHIANMIMEFKHLCIFVYFLTTKRPQNLLKLIKISKIKQNKNWIKNSKNRYQKIKNKDKI